MKRDDSSPKAYREDVEGQQSQMLERVREVIFEVAGEQEEGIEYGMLAYPGIGHLAAQKHYVSLYVDPGILDRFRHRFQADCGKSCVRFRGPEEIDRPLLLELLQAVKEGNP